MAVRVRLFAALREAAGVGEELLAPGPLPAVLEALRERHGERFTRVLGISTVLLDGNAVSRDAEVEVRDGAELALLPPVSGGADAATPSKLRVRLPAAEPTALVVAYAAALLAGRDAFAVAVVLAAGLALTDLAVLLDRGIARPVLAVAAVPGLALPVAIGIGADVGWSHLSAWFAGSLLALGAALMLGGRRWGALNVLGMTLLAALVVGLGAACLLLLRDGDDGLRWVALLAVLVAAAEGAARLAVLAGLPDGLRAAAPLATAALVAGGAATAGMPVLGLALLTPTAAAAVVGAHALLDVVRSEAGLPPRRLPLPPQVAGEGLVFGAAASTLLAAPVGFILAQAL